MAEYVEVAHLQAHGLCPEVEIVSVYGRYIGYNESQYSGQYEDVAACGMTAYGLACGIEDFGESRSALRIGAGDKSVFTHKYLN